MRAVFPIIAVLLISVGCQQDQKPDEAAPAGEPETAVMPAVPIPPAPSVPEGDLHGLEPDQILSVTFKEINEKGYPMVMLKNLTGRDIDDIRGSFLLKDAEGNVLHATGLTLAVPGDLLVAAGSEFESSPYGLNSKEDLMARLASAPEELFFSFEAQDVQFMEDSAEE